MDFEKSDYAEPWLHFKHPCVRQLAFCVASPNIIQSIPKELPIKHDFSLHSPDVWQQHFQNYYKRLLQLDNCPEPLLNFLNQLKSTRLGLRFEYLLWFWLQDHAYHPYQLIGHSIQQIKGSQTLGELDFLLINSENNKIEHWEVALKYYLGERNLSLPYWFGLNREDTLFKKLSHFTQKQFQFYSVQNYCIEKRYAVLKGQLFIPKYLNHLQPDIEWIEPTRRLGTWGHSPKAKYSQLTRHEWLCPNLLTSTNHAKWWTNGLYYNDDFAPSYYMFRQALLRHK